MPVPSGAIARISESLDRLIVQHDALAHHLNRLNSLV